MRAGDGSHCGRPLGTHGELARQRRALRRLEPGLGSRHGTQSQASSLPRAGEQLGSRQPSTHEAWLMLLQPSVREAGTSPASNTTSFFSHLFFCSRSWCLFSAFMIFFPTSSLEKHHSRGKKNNNKRKFTLKPIPVTNYWVYRSAIIKKIDQN